MIEFILPYLHIIISLIIGAGITWFFTHLSTKKLLNEIASLKEENTNLLESLKTLSVSLGKLEELQKEMLKEN